MTYVNIYNVLNDVKQIIVNTGLFKSVKIGLEDGITARDCPFARIQPVLEQSTDEELGVNLTINIVIGITFKQTDLEKAYAELLELEQKLKYILDLEVIQGGLCTYRETLFDSDELKNFKLAALSFEIKDIR